MATIHAERPDVVAAVIDRIKAPVGYIGHRVFPRTIVGDQAGNLYYKTLDSDAAAVTRSTEVSDFDRSTVGDSHTTYACIERSKTYQIPESREKAYGGIEKVDEAGVVAACRSVLRTFEGEAAALLVNSTNYAAATALVDGAVTAGITKAALSVGRYAGRTVLIGGTNFFTNLFLSTDISARMCALIGNSGFGADGVYAALRNDPRLVASLLRTFLPFDEILVGEDTFWNPSDYKDMGVVARIPSDEQARDIDMLYASEPVLGVAPWYLPDPSQPEIVFGCKSFFDDDNDCDVYRAKGWYDIKVLNSGAAAFVKFESPLLTTTTTTAST